MASTKETLDIPAPRPWSIDGQTIRDREGVVVMSALNPASMATRRLIVEAVNYYRPDLHCDWRELTPEEAVAHCREVAERLGDTPCARDHLQLAAWIEERARLRELVRRLVHQFEGRATYDDEAAIIREAREAVGEDEL